MNPLLNTQGAIQIRALECRNGPKLDIEQVLHGQSKLTATEAVSGVAERDHTTLTKLGGRLDNTGVRLGHFDRPTPVSENVEGSDDKDCSYDGAKEIIVAETVLTEEATVDNEDKTVVLSEVADSNQSVGGNMMFVVASTRMRGLIDESGIDSTPSFSSIGNSNPITPLGMSSSRR